MNRNNLEQLKEILKAHKFGEHLIQQMEANMAKDLPAFQLRDTLHTEKGQMDLSMNFRQSAKSDYYYFNNYKLELTKAKPLEKEHQYLVISETEGKNMMRKFDSALQAMEFFNGQKGNSELAIGKGNKDDLQFRNTVATMKEGKVDYVAKEFYGTFRTPLVTNTFYLKNDATFNVEQGVNLLQGRAVFRDDLLNRGGEQYSAWVQLDFDQKKDNFGNYKTRQFSEGYGFDLKKELESYQIKELADTKKTELILSELKEGNRPLVTVPGPDGQEQKLRIVAMPRYSNLNFFQTNGKPAIREDYKKEHQLSQLLDKNKGKDKSKNQEQENELAL
ncbi:hypothetical protein HDC92_002847 [Pedobacter sp. AK017]|uniref:hypothetical protein n=1 Tax=Pedobacter sp. AK017 TaxID=2723073 RepID=UPI001615F578|nr:hypothetical protein [Pedobacter sp. AK017]MBB5439160.1 hypothetical protein [Pedobacter sp. AK017]